MSQDELFNSALEDKQYIQQISSKLKSQFVPLFTDEIKILYKQANQTQKYINFLQRQCFFISNNILSKKFNPQNLKIKKIQIRSQIYAIADSIDIKKLKSLNLNNKDLLIHGLFHWILNHIYKTFQEGYTWASFVQKILGQVNFIQNLKNFEIENEYQMHSTTQQISNSIKYGYLKTQQLGQNKKQIQNIIKILQLYKEIYQVQKQLMKSQEKFKDQIHQLNKKIKIIQKHKQIKQQTKRQIYDEVKLLQVRKQQVLDEVNSFSKILSNFSILKPQQILYPQKKLSDHNSSVSNNNDQLILKQKYQENEPPKYQKNTYNNIEQRQNLQNNKINQKDQIMTTQDNMRKPKNQQLYDDQAPNNKNSNEESNSRHENPQMLNNSKNTGSLPTKLEVVIQPSANQTFLGCQCSSSNCLIF